MADAAELLGSCVVTGGGGDAGAGTPVTSDALRASFVALIFVDAGVAACADAARVLQRLAVEVDAAGRGVRLLPVVVPLGPVGAEWLAQALGDAWARTAHVPPGHSAVAALRRACGLGAATALPEVCCVDGAAGAVVATDTWRALQRGDANARNFPAGWRTNVLLPVPWTAALAAAAGGGDGGDAPAHHVRMHSESQLRARLYPGDTVLVRGLPPLYSALRSAAAAAAAAASRGGGADADAAARARGPEGPRVSSVCAYVNAPLDEVLGDRRAEAVEGAPLPAEDGQLLVPSAVLADLTGAGPAWADAVGGGVRVAVEAYPDPPAAERVVFARVPLAAADSAVSSTTTAAGDRVAGGSAALLQPFFGTSRAVATAITDAFVDALARARWAADGEHERDAVAALADDALAAVGAAARGAPAAPASAAAAAPPAGVSTAEAAFLEQYVVHAACRYVPVVTGQTVVVHAAGGGGAAAAFRVASTLPRFAAVVVHPDTELVVDECAREAL